MKTRTINFVKMFTDCPGGRLRIHGDFSGQQFREDILEPALESGDMIEINLDGVLGFPASFIDEAFGVLVDKFGLEKVRSQIKLLCSDNPFALQSISEIMDHHAA